MGVIIDHTRQMNVNFVVFKTYNIPRLTPRNRRRCLENRSETVPNV